MRLLPNGLGIYLTIVYNYLSVSSILTMRLPVDPSTWQRCMNSDAVLIC